MKIMKLLPCMSLFLCSAVPSMSQQRQPIRVGGNFQESKLIYKVEPTYPEAALKEEIQGWVILVINVNEKGEVEHLRVVDGHPLLDQAAIDAVRQWRYLPTYLDGKPVSVMATVVVDFRISSRLVLDESGTLRSEEGGIKGDALIQELKGKPGTVIIQPNAKAPFRLFEMELRALKEHEIQFAITGGSYVFHNGRLFYVIPGLPEEPELALDKEYLADIAAASGGLPTAINLDSNGLITLAYQLFLTETGRVLSIKRLQAPEISEVEAELARTKVVTPALFAAKPVPSIVTVEIPISYERIKRR
jgi:TonB family protein